MIYTVTFNPALDYIMYMDGLSVGGVNRVRAAKILCGGKGINVSWVLHNLGVKSVALGFVAGFTGREIERLLAEHGCRTDFVRLGHGMSRINVKLVADEESDLNAPGPQIGTLEPFFRKLDGLTAEDTIVLAGSLPAGLPQDTYEQVLARASTCSYVSCGSPAGRLPASTMVSSAVRPSSFLKNGSSVPICGPGALRSLSSSATSLTLMRDMPCPSRTKSVRQPCSASSRSISRPVKPATNPSATLLTPRLCSTHDTLIPLPPHNIFAARTRFTPPTLSPSIYMI